MNSNSFPAYRARSAPPRSVASTFFAAVISAIATIGPNGFADNPVVQTSFTADPAPFVDKDTVYLITSHDEDDARGFHMLDWKCYSTEDMVNWTDHGAIASLATFPWAQQDTVLNRVRDVANLRPDRLRAKEGHFANLDPEFPRLKAARNFGPAPAQKALRLRTAAGGSGETAGR